MLTVVQWGHSTANCPKALVLVVRMYVRTYTYSLADSTYTYWYYVVCTYIRTSHMLLCTHMYVRTYIMYTHQLCQLEALGSCSAGICLCAGRVSTYATASTRALG